MSIGNGPSGDGSPWDAKNAILAATILSVSLIAVGAALVYIFFKYNSSQKVVDISFSLDISPELALKSARQPVIYFSTQSGRAEQFARELQGRLSPSVPVLDLAEFNPSSFVNRRLAIFVVATYGDGEAPDSARPFAHWLEQPSVPTLNDLRFAVFGLCDSSYSTFNAFALNLEARLLALHATPLVPAGEGDAFASDPVADFAAWSGSLLPVWGSASAALEAEIGAPQTEETADVVPVSFVVEASEIALHAELTRRGLQLVSSVFDNNQFGADVHERALFKSHIIDAQVISTEETRPTSTHEATTKLVKLRVPATSDQPQGGYHTAGTLEMFPRNPAADVRSILSLLRVPTANLPPTPDMVVAFAAPAKGTPSVKPAFPTPCTLGAALTSYVDLARPFSRSALKTILDYPDWLPSAAERASLAALLESPLLTALYEDHKLSLVEFCSTFTPSLSIPVDALFSLRLLPVIRSRAYSIASASSVSPLEPAILVSRLAVDRKPLTDAALLAFTAPRNLPALQAPAKSSSLGGLASSYVTQALAVGQRVSLSLKGSAFHAPPPGAPVLLVGAGTGLAPLLGVLEQLDLERKNGSKRRAVLIFGCRAPADDFLLQSLLERYERDGVCTLVTAFSRAPGLPKRYVQHVIAQERDRLATLLGGSNGVAPANLNVLVCGSTSMGVGVEVALEDWLVGGVAGLRSKGAFAAELWSSA